jgi:hypothetical protein
MTSARARLRLRLIHYGNSTAREMPQYKVILLETRKSWWHQREYKCDAASTEGKTLKSKTSVPCAAKSRMLQGKREKLYVCRGNAYVYANALTHNFNKNFPSKNNSKRKLCTEKNPVWKWTCLNKTLPWNGLSFQFIWNAEKARRRAISIRDRKSRLCTSIWLKSWNKHMHASIHVHVHPSFPIPLLFLHLSSPYVPKSTRTQRMRPAHVQHARADHARHRCRRKPSATGLLALVVL